MKYVRVDQAVAPPGYTLVSTPKTQTFVCHDLETILCRIFVQGTGQIYLLFPQDL